MRTKILFTDLDGTLLNDQKEISERTKKALYAFHEKGHLLVFTTGRPLKSVLEVRETLGLLFPNCYIIAYNGGLIWHCDTNTPVIEHTIPREDVCAILEETRALRIHCHTYENDVILFERECEELAFYKRHIHLPARRVPDLTAALKKDPYKLIAIRLDDQTPLKELQARVLARLSGRIQAVFSNAHYLEFYPVTSGKGNAVAGLSAYLGIPLSDTAAIGDEANDISMLEAAGAGWAMCNASACVKAHADFVTAHDNNHDGICELLERF